jgi:hypothetical protein
VLEVPLSSDAAHERGRELIQVEVVTPCDDPPIFNLEDAHDRQEIVRSSIVKWSILSVITSRSSATTCTMSTVTLPPSHEPGHGGLDRVSAADRVEWPVVVAGVVAEQRRYRRGAPVGHAAANLSTKS